MGRNPLARHGRHRGPGRAQRHAQQYPQHQDSHETPVRSYRRQERHQRGGQHGVTKHSPGSYDLSEPTSRKFCQHVAHVEAAQEEVLIVFVPGVLVRVFLWFCSVCGLVEVVAVGDESGIAVGGGVSKREDHLYDGYGEVDAKHVVEHEAEDHHEVQDEATA